MFLGLEDLLGVPLNGRPYDLPRSEEPRAQGIRSLTPREVDQNKMDKAHLRGQTEIGVNELLVNGLSSKLPLHLDGRSVPMQVSVHVPPPLRPASQVVSSLEPWQMAVRAA